MMAQSDSSAGRGGQNLARRFVVRRVIQKLRPSLVAPKGPVLAPVEKEARGVRSAAFRRETLLPEELVTRMRWPSKAAAEGPSSPLPVREDAGTIAGRGISHLTHFPPCC